MQSVYENFNGAKLYYLSADEYERLKEYDADYSALLCAKNPYHKDIVGYLTNCPKDNPEYLVAYRPKEHIMALNMVDAKKPEFFSDEMVFSGLDFIRKELDKCRDVVVVCNQGESRSPTMCLMFLMKNGVYDTSLSHTEVFMEFGEENLEWNPNNGILLYAVEFWNRIKRGEI
jgi:hypothetical protein